MDGPEDSTKRAAKKPQKNELPSVTLMKFSSQIRGKMLDLISRATFILDKLLT